MVFNPQLHHKTAWGGSWPQWGYQKDVRKQALYWFNLRDSREPPSHLSADKIILREMLPTGSPGPGEMSWRNTHSLFPQGCGGYTRLNTKG